MKKLLLSLSVVMLMAFPAMAFEHAVDLKSEAPIGNLEHVTSLHKSIFITGQPDEETLSTLKDKGFEVVVNIRGADEITFDEKGMVEAQGIHYYNIPLTKDDQIQDTAVSQIHEALKSNKGKKILLHCSSGNRAAGWLGAHLVQKNERTADEAIALAKEAGMTKDVMEKMLRDYFVTISK